MKITKCNNGHFYDAEWYTECPFCKKTDTESAGTIPARFAALGTLQKTGQGSTGSVYRISGEKEYALKEIACHRDMDKYQNALYEIAVMQTLSATNKVVHLYDCEEKSEGDDKTIYLLEEHLTPFPQFLAEQAPTVSDLLRMAIGLCDSLIACRDAGVAQLDVQPKNLFVDADGTVKIGDFGCSLFLSDLKNNRLMRGTPAFMAPEVYQRGLCSEQSDIYSAGILLYCLFNEKRLPFMESGNGELAIYKRLAGTPLPEMAYRDARLMPGLKQIIADACAFSTENRMKTFEELREKLQLLYQEAQCSGAGSQPAYPAGHMPVAAAPAPKDMSAFDADPFAETPAPGNMDAYDTCAPGSAGDFDTCATDSAGIFDTCAPGSFDTGAPESTDAFNTCSPGALAPLACPAPQPSMAAPTPPAGGNGMDMRKVQFSAVAPKTFTKGDYSMVEIVMYEEAYRKIVDELIAEAEAPVKETKSGIFKVADGATVRIALTSPDLEIEDGEEEQEWQGGYLNFSFAVMLPEDYKKRQILFTASVYINDVIATRLKFVAKSFSLFEQKVKVSREDVLSAFISYASQDRHRVAAIIQGMKKARPEMDIFFDVESLRSGDDWEKALYREIEQRDILFLFWSQSARESKWVDAEWRYAMGQKGVECIEPVPIDPPGMCPPPPELGQKHFNDKLLYIINENGR